jgi:hypothetical protein
MGKRPWGKGACSSKTTSNESFQGCPILGIGFPKEAATSDSTGLPLSPMLVFFLNPIKVEILFPLEWMGGGDRMDASYVIRSIFDNTPKY